MGEVIILGDLNAEVAGAKCAKPKSPRSPQLLNVLTEHNVTSVTVQAKCKGPGYTYDPYDSGIKRSLIDHVLIGCDQMDVVSKSWVISKESTVCYNSSDHLPVIVQLNLDPLLIGEGLRQIVRPKRIINITQCLLGDD